MNLEQARNNMIMQQVRTWDVLDGRVLDVLRDTPREEFVPPRHRKLAFADLRIPLGHDQVMMRPIEQGRLLQALMLSDQDRVLEVGTGSGYLTACLARLAGEVISIETFSQLAEQAASNLKPQGMDNIELQTGDVFEQRYPEEGFDAVVVTASVPAIPESLPSLLRPGGRLFVVRGRSPAMEALVVTRTESGRLTEESLYETDLPRLIGTEEAPVFDF